MSDWLDVILEVLTEGLKGIVEWIVPSPWKIVGIILITILGTVGQHMLRSSNTGVTPSPAVVVVTQIVTQSPALGWSGSSNSSNLSTSQREAENTTVSSCENSPKRLRVGEWAEVCTWSSREPVVMREGPGVSYFPSGHELVTGAKVYVLDGPVCDEDSTWWYWKVRTETKGYVGWMAEGGDNKDPYFLCPSP